MTDTQGIAEIIEQARCGDLEARCALVKIHHLALRSYLAAICGNPSVTDDLAQEVFLRALDRLDRVIDPAKRKFLAVWAVYEPEITLKTAA